jgi:MoxR-like ATPase
MAIFQTRRKKIMLVNKMLAVINAVNDEVAERHELIVCIAIALLTSTNLFILGKTGQAKSYVINEFRDRIKDAKQFERLLTKQTDEESIFGRIDLSTLIPGNPDEDILAQDSHYQDLLSELRNIDTDNIDGASMLLTKIDTRRKVLYALHGNKPKLITAGKIPDSHIVFLDELFKCNDGLLNSLLTALNEGKKFINSTTPITGRWVAYEKDYYADKTDDLVMFQIS